MTLPRPEITDALGAVSFCFRSEVSLTPFFVSHLAGIGYRRIPILAIGNDVYCDTSLILPILEQHFPVEKGYRSIYPKRKDGGNPDTGMVRALSTFYMDRPLFSLASNSLPWDKFARDFIEDRGKVRCAY